MFIQIVDLKYFYCSFEYAILILIVLEIEKSRQ